MENQTIEIIEFKHVYTLRGIKSRPRSTQYDAFGKCVTKVTPNPKYKGMPNMALVSCRPLTRTELLKYREDAQN